MPTFTPLLQPSTLSITIIHKYLQTWVRKKELEMKTKRTQLKHIGFTHVIKLSFSISEQHIILSINIYV